MWRRVRNESYPPIDDYAFISDCDNVALISRCGSIDWCCMPRIDADSCFARLLDWRSGGCFFLQPAAGDFETRRHYMRGSLVLVTCFRTATGEARLTDFFAHDHDGEHRDHLFRIVEGVAGEVAMRVRCEPRFDYGEVEPFIAELDADSDHRQRTFSAIGSNKALIVHSDHPLQIRDNGLEANFHIRAGEQCHVSLWFTSPQQADCQRGSRADHPDAQAELRHCLDWWQAWSSQLPPALAADGQTLCSAAVLKGLIHEPTGAVAAAPTTSLPEWIGGCRNWDYRYSWVRDSTYTVSTFYHLGVSREAERFARFIERSSAGSARQVQLMYAVDGKRRLPEQELDWLEGYRGSRPVRIGNDAWHQTQLDLFGELLLLADLAQQHGHAPPPSYRRFLDDLVERACQHWQEPDDGIWEARGEQRHYVYSKAHCWAALDVGIRLRQQRGETPPPQWERTREAIRQAIDSRGYDAERGIFVQSFGSDELDASLLRLPLLGYVDYRDPRMLRTVAAICAGLEKNGLLYRYRDSDGLPGEEGTFLACTFWLAECLARQGELERAQRYYQRACACANDLGLMPEEVDPRDGTALGNFPQGLTHIAQINALLALIDARDAS